MKKLLALMLLCVLLSGCSALTDWMDGSYHNSYLYQEEGYQSGQQTISVTGYTGLRTAVTELVEAGRESATITAQELQEDFFASSMDKVVEYVMTTNPIGAYAVEEITYELGTSGGMQAVAVNIAYNHNHSEIRNIQNYGSMEDALKAITDALDDCEDSIVLRVSGYTALDLTQVLQDYADENPNLVMEMPQVAVNTYPQSGFHRVVEVQFSYQTSRETLRSMQEYVAPVFSAASLYVRGDTESAVKYAQLYSFLMERFPYSFQTSITPSYSLLRYGVGDSKAFAQVYAAMCRQSGLECLMVSGTYQGEARFWNIVCIDGTYYHADLLWCDEQGEYILRMDGEMQDYVWDYSAYPQCVPPEELSETEPPQT